MGCQFQVYQSQNLSLSLHKCLFFPAPMEFVGVDSCLIGNRPAMSKSKLYKQWPPFVVARDIASFLGFMNFYSKFITYFKHRAAPLCILAKLKMTASVDTLLKSTH